MSALTDKEYLGITIPFMLSTMTQPLMGAVNTAVMGQMSDAKYVAAVSLGVILFNTIYWIFGFLRVSTTGYAAQANGAKDTYQGMLAFFKPCIIALLVGCCCLVLQNPIIDVYLAFISPQPDVAVLCRQYYSLLIWGAPMVLFNYVALGWLMGQTRIKASVGMQVSMNLLNCILSIYFVNYLHMDVDGVAWAMLLCQIYGGILAAILMYVYGCFEYSRLPWKELLDWHQFVDMLKVNSNLMIRTMCLMTVNNILAAVGAGFGTSMLAANAVLLQIKDIMSYLIDGMANGAAIFSGKAKGQASHQLLEETIAITYKWLVVLSLLIMGIYHLWHQYFIGIFTEITDVLVLANEYSFYVTLYPLVSGVGMVLYGVFCGVTKTAPIRNMMLIALSVFYVLKSFFVPWWGNDGLWMAYLSFFVAQSIILSLFLKGLKKNLLGIDDILH